LKKENGNSRPRISRQAGTLFRPPGNGLATGPDCPLFVSTLAEPSLVPIVLFSCPRCPALVGLVLFFGPDFPIVRTSRPGCPVCLSGRLVPAVQPVVRLSIVRISWASQVSSRHKSIGQQVIERFRSSSGCGL